MHWGQTQQLDALQDRVPHVDFHGSAASRNKFQAVENGGHSSLGQDVESVLSAQDQIKRLADESLSTKRT